MSIIPIFLKKYLFPLRKKNIHPKKMVVVQDGLRGGAILSPRKIELHFLCEGEFDTLANAFRGDACCSPNIVSENI